MLVVGAPPRGGASVFGGKWGIRTSLRIMLLSVYYERTTGYGTQAASLLPRLAAMPEVGGASNVAQATIGNSKPRRITDKYPIYPLPDTVPYQRPTDAARIASLAGDFGADLWVSLYDVRGIPGFAQAVAPSPWLAWTPIDCFPMSRLDVEALDGCHTAIAMSKFGLHEMQEAGIKNAVYIPHGVESTFGVNHDAAYIRSVRAKLVGPDCEHLTVIVARNTKGDRKNYPGMLEGWAAFAKGKPGARLYVHSSPPWNEGAPDLVDVVKSLGIPQDQVIMPLDLRDTLYSERGMADVYNASDVLLLASRGEGFGLPALEAQACGTPAVVTKFSAQPELLRWGIAVDFDDLIWQPTLGGYWAQPRTKDITAALQALYEEQQSYGGRWPVELRQAVSSVIHSEFGWDHVFREMWAPLVRGLASRNTVALSTPILGG